MKPIIFVLSLITGLVLVQPSSSHAASGEELEGMPQFDLEQVTGPVTLRNATYIDSDVVHLGDIFLNTGSLANKAVAYAPVAGDMTTYGARWLMRVAQYYGLEWRPETPRTEIQIVRESLIITHEEIMDAIRFAMLDYGMPQDMEPELVSRNIRIFLPINARPDVAVEDFRFDERTNRFTVIVAAPAGDLSAKRLKLSGRIYQTMEVPFTTRPISVGEVIKTGDIEWRNIRSSKVSSDTLTSDRDILGKSPRRGLKSGDMIRMSQIESPVLIPRRSLVTVRLVHPYMTLTVQGRALENGSMGDVIRIKNNFSNTILDAVVTGSGQAVVHISSQVAMN